MRAMRKSRTTWLRRMRWECRMRGLKQSSYSKQVGGQSVVTNQISFFARHTRLWHLWNDSSCEFLQCLSGWLRVLVAPSPLLSQNNCSCFPCSSRWNTHIQSYLSYLRHYHLQVFFFVVLYTLYRLTRCCRVSDRAGWKWWQLWWIEEGCKDLPVSDVSGTPLHRANPHGPQCPTGGRSPGRCGCRSAFYLHHITLEFLPIITDHKRKVQWERQKKSKASDYT